jgi:hypothetical protein
LETDVCAKCLKAHKLKCKKKKKTAFILILESRMGFLGEPGNELNMRF